MSIGKYSPTVSMWYYDQEWFEKNGGNCGVIDEENNVTTYTIYDKDGYDSYGYHKDTQKDRAGYEEDDYLTDSIRHWNRYSQEGSEIYETVSREYGKVPVPTCQGVEKINGFWRIKKSALPSD